MIASGESLENATEVSEIYGGGYLTTFGVYHEIHCLVRVATSYSDRYT